LKQHDCDCAYSSVGDLVFRCPKHQSLEMCGASGRVDSLVVKKQAVLIGENSDGIIVDGTLQGKVTRHPVAGTSTTTLAHFGTGPLPLITDDSDLLPLLRQATNEELAPLVEYILRKGGWSSELEGTAVFKKHHPHHRIYADDIAAEIQMFGANTLTSDLFRNGRGVCYKEIVQDVAKRCKVKSHSGAKVEDLELAIIESIWSTAWDSMSVDEREAVLSTLEIDRIPGLGGTASIGALQAAIRAGGFLPYQAAVVVANGLANATLGHGLSFAANAALTKGVAIFAGPVGLAFTAILGTIAFAGPAYRVTIPCVVQVGAIRQMWLRRSEEERKRRQERRMQIIFWVALAIIVVALIVWSPDLYCQLFSCAKASVP
jgi:uncharacterized protein YaaW (UPF0174 family)